MPEKNWYEKLIEEYHKELGLKDKLHLIQKLLREIEKDISMKEVRKETASP